MSSGHPGLVIEIAAEIARSGPITFARFMELALYHSEFGYYVRPSQHPHNERIGWDGDFYTSSDVHPILGEALAKQAIQLDEILGHPDSFTVVEMGPGKGFLARDFLAACSRSPASLFHRLRYVLIERSPTMRNLQRHSLAQWMGADGPVTWVENLSDLPAQSAIGLFLSNELVDAFAVHRIQIVNGRPQEIYVDSEGGRFIETMGPLSVPELEQYLHRVAPALADGYRTEVNLEALTWIREVARCLARGLVITIDYGHTAQDLYSPDRKRGTLLCYYHQTASEDPYSRVGEQDMTAHVDFTSLAAVGEETGLSTTGFTNQMSFLMGLGAEQMLEAMQPESPEFFAAIQLLRSEGMGRTFKVLIQHKGIAKPALDGLTFQPFFGEALTVHSAA